MFYSRTLNNKINRLHKRALRIACSDNKSSFNKLIEKVDSFTTHHRNLKKLTHLQLIIETFRSLLIEVYTFLNGLSISIMSNVFKQNHSILYEVRNCNTFRSREPTLRNMVQAQRHEGVGLFEKNIEKKHLCHHNKNC